MTYLPTEVLDIVSASLAPQDVLSFRLVCKTFAAVGARYMLPTIPLACFPEYFTRLEDVSNHKVISQYVNTIVFETDRLPRMFGFQDYRAEARLSSITIDLPPAPPHDADERTKRAWNRDMVKEVTKPHQVPLKKLREGWTNYQSFYKLQQNLLDSAEPMWSRRWYSRVIEKFPRLTKLRVQTLGYLPLGNSLCLKKPWKKSLLVPYRQDAAVESIGVEELLILLISYYDTKKDLREITAGLIGWTFFGKAASQLYILLRRTYFKSLRDLQMDVACHDEALNDESFEAFENWTSCRKALSTGCVRDFVQAAPNLERICLLFNQHDMHNPINLENLFGTMTWNNLRSLNFRAVDTTEAELLSLFERHAKTLKLLGLACIKLTGADDLWVTTILRIPEILDLDGGALEEYFEDSMYALEMEIGSERDEDQEAFHKAVQALLCRAGWANWDKDTRREVREEMLNMMFNEDSYI